MSTASALVRCSGNLCDDVPRATDGTHYWCQCGAEARRDLAARGINIPQGHWVHVVKVSS